MWEGHNQKLEIRNQMCVSETHIKNPVSEMIDCPQARRCFTQRRGLDACRWFQHWQASHVMVIAYHGASQETTPLYHNILLVGDVLQVFPELRP